MFGMTKMDPAVRDRWLTALRGGAYAQTRRVLHDRETGGYCCLGVLCDVYRQETGRGDWETHGTDFDGLRNRDVALYLGEALVPPAEVLAWAGLEIGNADRLAGMNDEGKDFEDIAEEIEANL